MLIKKKSVKDKYPKLHKVNKDCMENVNEIKAARKRKTKQTNGIEGIERISRDKSQNNYRMEKAESAEKCLKWVQMKTDHDECKKSLENVKDRYYKLAKQIEKWKTSKRQLENAIKKTQEQLLGESDRFQNMIIEKLDFVNEKYTKKMDDE